MFEQYYLDQFVTALSRHTFSLIHKEEENLLRYLCPIYLQKTNGILEHIGTTILLKIRPNNYFLITAAHVLDQKTQGSLCLIGRESLIPLNYDFHITSIRQKDSRQDDEFDFSLTQLDNSILSKISPYNDFYLVDDVVTDFDFKIRKLYTFMGFPNTQNKVGYGIRSQAHSLNTFLASREDYKKYRIDPSIHIAVKFEKQDLVDSNSRKTTFPKPIGLSGGGVWTWNVFDESKVGNVKVIPKLAGMIIEMTSDRQMWIAIRITHILETIRKKFPALSSDIPKPSDIKINIRFEDEQKV